MTQTQTIARIGFRLGGMAILLFAVAAGFGRALPATADEATATCPIVGRAPRPGIDYDARYAVITFTNACGQPAPLRVDIAADEARQETGLMNITSLPADQGELFDFDNIAGGAPVQVGFWMKDTLVPLSIAFVSADGTVQEIQDMQPQSLDIHTPAQPYLYAIEANQGWFARNGVTAGARVDVSAALALTH